MKTSITLALILAMLVFVTETNARPEPSKSRLLTIEDLEAESDFAEILKQHVGNGRRTRHSRQTISGYSNSWSYPFESRFLFLLEQINMRVKLINEQLSSRTPPYPAVISIPQYYPLPIEIENMPSVSNFNNRFSEVPIWGYVPDNAVAPSDDDDDEGLRPISLKPSKQGILVGVHTPPVEHGSIQGEKSTTQNLVSTAKEPKMTMNRQPTVCEAAILSCCRFDEPERKSCFKQYNCSKTYETGNACLKEVISMVIKIFIDAYKPR